MRLFSLTILLIFNLCFTYAQTIKELYSQRNFNELIKFESNSDLTKEECYFIGYAFFQLENDTKAIQMYDLAISKGLDKDYIYLYKGLSLRYDKQYDKAIDAFHLAIQRNPIGQKNYTELANVYYYTQRYDSALIYFYKAREQKFELGDPYDKIPNIYHTQENFDKALEEYYISASLIDKGDPKYIVLLKNIGLLEYTITKNYKKSIAAYTEMLSLIPQEYGLYAKLIKAYYADEQYTHGDSVFNVLRDKYSKNELSKELMENKSEMVDELIWNGQKVNVLKYFEIPQNFAEPIYQFFLIDKSGKKVEKKFLTEKTNSEMDGTKHLLCGIDKGLGMHYTYPIGWKSDEVDYKQLKQYVLEILDNKIKPQASSNTVR